MIEGNRYIEPLSGLFADLVDEHQTLLVSEWAEQNRYLPEELTPDPGYWRNDRAPYLTEIMDCMSSSSPIKQIDVMKGAQGGFTTGVLENPIGYNIDCAPCPILYMTADKDLAKIGIEVKIDRMIDSIDGLAEKIRPAIIKKHGKTTGDTVTRKDFPGGFLLAIGARSPAKMRQISVQWLLIDEIDGFPLEVGREGCPVKLAEQRTKNFANSKKILTFGTPTIMQTSRILKRYNGGDRREYHAPCPRCGELQTLHFFLEKDGSGVHWETERDQLIPDSVYYQCKHCMGKIQNAEKIIFLGEGKWIPGRKILDKFRRSYFWPPLLSPWYPWADMVKNWLDSQGNIASMKSFFNTDLGLPWEEKGEAPSEVEVISHRRMYSSRMIPNKLCRKETGGPIIFLTAAVDTQDNGLYVEVRGWSELCNSWSIAWDFLEGDTGKPKVWADLKKYLYDSIFLDETGKKYQILIAAIDAGGHRTKEVYRHCQSYGEQFLIPINGDRYIRGDGGRAKPWSQQQPKPGYPGLQAFHVNTTWYKNHIAHLFKQEWQTGEQQPPGYLNYPEDYGQDFFKMYTAESLFMEKDPRTGAIKSMYWKQTKAANHAFDVAVYNHFILEWFADSYCKTRLRLEELDWAVFWVHAKTW